MRTEEDRERGSDLDGDRCRVERRARRVVDGDRGEVEGKQWRKEGAEGGRDELIACKRGYFEQKEMAQKIVVAKSIRYPIGCNGRFHLRHVHQLDEAAVRDIKTGFQPMKAISEWEIQRPRKLNQKKLLQISCQWQLHHQQS